ncbi:MAG: hypothetical protein ABSB41_01930 [Anaerolineales bacterium]
MTILGTNLFTSAITYPVFTSIEAYMAIVLLLSLYEIGMHFLDT